MLSNNKRIEELETKVETLSHMTKVLRDEVFALSDKLREQDEQIAELTKKLQDKQDIIEEQEKEIRKWNEGIAHIMNYSLDVAKGGAR